MAGIIFPTDLQQVKPQDETLLLGADANNIARNIKASELVDYVKSKVPLDELAETISEQQATISEQQAAASEQVRTIARLVATQSAPALEAELAAGKTDLASAITAKGVETAPTDSLATMADKVREIQTKKITIDGGEMYAKQLYGSLTPPKFWNLYDVLAQLLSDGRLSQYGGILLAEYYRGYDSLALSGAGAGGGYVVSDKNADGQFIMYTEDIVHTWNTAFDGYGNRWVAYCFATEYHDFEITDTDTSPRSIYIGRKVGAVLLLANSRCSDYVIPDGNSLRSIKGNYTQKFGRNVIIKNIEKIDSVMFYRSLSNTESLYVQAKEITAMLAEISEDIKGLRSVIIKADRIDTEKNMLLNFDGINVNFQISYYAVMSPYIRTILMGRTPYSPSFSALDTIYIKTEDGGIGANISSAGLPTTREFVLDIEFYTNDKTKSVSFYSSSSGGLGVNLWQKVKDAVLCDNWCKPLNISVCINLTETNMYSHILQRLKQDEPDCGDGVTITLGSTNLAKLTSEESVQLLDALTNIYGYTFA